MSPLTIILPVVASVFIIIGIALFFFLKKCIRWRAVSLVNPKKRSMSDESIIRSAAYTISSIDGRYQTLGSLPVFDVEQISAEVKPVEGSKYLAEGLPNPEFNNRRNSFRKSFRGKISQVTSKSQELILNKQMGVYNIPENELKYYKENCLKYKVIGETNENFEHSDFGGNLELDRPNVECNLTPNSNLKIEVVSSEPLNSNSRIEEAEKPLYSNSRIENAEKPLYSKSRTEGSSELVKSRKEVSSELVSSDSRKEVLVEALSPGALQRIEKCLKNKIDETRIVMQNVEVTTSVVVSEEIVKEDCKNTEENKNISRE